MKRQKSDYNKKKEQPVKTKIVQGINPKAVKETKPETQYFVVWSLIIVAITLFAYSLAFKGELTSWDDDEYVINNPNLESLKSENIKNIFSEYYMGNYHPLAMLSLSIDYQFGGKDKAGNLRPFIYHFTNILLHVLITLLVFWFAYLLFNNFKIAVISSLLFGVSTLHVESVAWVSERKDVLYAFYFVASAIYYVKFADTKNLKYYLLSVFLFILSLLSKGQAVSLAVTIIAIDILRKRNLKDLKIILEKIPFLILAVIFGIVAVNAQKAGNAIVSGEEYNIIQRIGFAGYAFTNYIIQLTIPINLSAIYPYPDILSRTIPANYYLYLFPAIGVGLAYLYSFKRYPEIAFSIAFFIINIILLLQFIPVGSAIHADRYAYIPSIGFYIAFGIFSIKFIENKKINQNIIYGIVGIYSIYMAFMTFERTKVWQNSEALWTDTCKKSPKAVVAWNNLGSLLDKKASKEVEANNLQKSIDIRLDAIEKFNIAIAGKPDYVHAYYNRGSSKQEISKITNDAKLTKEAIEDFSESLKFDPLFAEGYHNRGVAYETQNQYDKAIKDFNQAIELKPGELSFYVNRGVALGKSGKADLAIKDFDYVLGLQPNNYQAYSNRGLAKNILGLHQEAISDFNKSIELNSEFQEAYNNRAIAKQSLSLYKEAIDDLNIVLKKNNRNGGVYYLRALSYLNMGMNNEACADLKKALEYGDTRANTLLNKYCK